MQPTVGGEPETREFSEAEIQELAGAGKKNRWIAASNIEAASIKEGATTSRLSVQLRDGTKAKLLWLKTDPAAKPLRAALARWGVVA